jgi:hypothetical protein
MRPEKRVNDVQPWFTDVLERIMSGRTKALNWRTLLPWNWIPENAPLLIAGSAALAA